MKQALSLIAPAMLLCGPVALSAPTDPAPPSIDIPADDPVISDLAKRYPEVFAANPGQVVLNITPADPDRQPATTSIPRPTATATIPPGLAALAKFQGKKGRTDNNVISATRAGDQPDIKVIALSPGDEGLTVKGQPSLWWYQSGPSGNAEVEFVLTEIVGRRPNELLRVPLKAMPQGFNSLNLASPILNPRRIVLKPDTTYQWTIAIRSAEANAAVFAKLRRVHNQSLETSIANAPTAAATLEALSTSGNWYELFDIVSRLARHFPDNKDVTATRAGLLRQAGLSELLPK